MDPVPAERAAAPAPPSLPGMLVALVAAAAGVLGVAALWTVLNVRTDQVNGWATLVAAADAALLLRLAGMRGGWQRATLGVAATLATVLLVGFLTAATRMGLAMGLRPLESAGRMSAELAWMLVESAAGPWDLGAVLVGLGLAWWMSK